MRARSATPAIVLFLLLVLILSPTPVNAASGPVFGLRPAHPDPARPATKGYFIYDTASGQQIQDEVVVRNGGDVAGVLRLYAVDSMTAESTGTVFPDEEIPRTAVGSWIQLTEQELSLGPGEERIVPFTVTIPSNAGSGQHVGGIAVVNGLITQGTPTGSVQINTRNRAVTAVQVNLPGTLVEKVAVTGVATGGRQARQTIVLGLNNEGTEMVKPLGTLVVTTSQGQEVQRLPLKLDTFLPGSAIQYPVAVQNQALGVGQYHAKVDLTYGASGVTSYEGDFSITTAQIAQTFPSSVALAAPPVAATGASAAPTTTTTVAAAQWPLFVGGGVLMVLVLLGGIFLGRRGRSGGAVK